MDFDAIVVMGELGREFWLNGTERVPNLVRRALNLLAEVFSAHRIDCSADVWPPIILRILFDE